MCFFNMAYGTVFDMILVVVEPAKKPGFLTARLLFLIVSKTAAGRNGVLKMGANMYSLGLEGNSMEPHETGLRPCNVGH